jgi:hypothetical protein
VFGAANSTIGVTAPAALTNPNTAAPGHANFDAKDYAVCVSNVSGQEVCGCRATTGDGTCNAATPPVVCGVNGTVDLSAGCGLGGNATVNYPPSLPRSATGIGGGAAKSGAFAPPLADLSSVAIVVGDANSGSVGNDNSFGSVISRLTLLCGPNYPPTPASNTTNQVSTPGVLLWNREGEEASNFSLFSYAGPCLYAHLYTTRGNGLWSNLLPTSGHLSPGGIAGVNYYNMVIDAYYYNATSDTTVIGSSFNCNIANNGCATANVLVRGTDSQFQCFGCHFENPAASGGDNVIATWGGNASLFGGVGYAKTNAGFGPLHRTLTGGNILAQGFQSQAGGNTVIQDDPRNIRITNATTQVDTSYDSLNYVAKNYLLADQSGIATTTLTNIGASGAGNTPFTFGIEASKNYLLRCELIYNASVATAGMNIQVTGPAAPVAVANSLTGGTTATTVAVVTGTGFSAPLSVGNAVTAAGTFPVHFVEYIQNGVNQGNISVQDAPQGVGTLINKAGSECDLTPQTQQP